MPKHLAIILGKVDGLDPIGAMTINLANGLSQLGYRVTLLTGSAIDMQQNDRVTLKTPEVTSRIFWLHLIRIRRWLDRTLVEIKPDVTIAMHSIFRAQINVPTQGLLHHRMLAGNNDGTTLRERLMKRAACLLPSIALRLRFERQMLHDESLETLVALSPLCEAQLTACEKKDGVTICGAAMPVPDQRIEPARAQRSRATLARAFGLDTDAYWICHPFQSATVDGLETMIRAFKPLIDEGHNAVLLLAGPYRYTHLAWIADLRLRDAVRFVGKTARGENLIAACDLAVCPTSDDPAGWGVLPALGTDTPVVTTASCGLADTVKQRGGTVLESPVEAMALLEAIRTCHRAWLDGGDQTPVQPVQSAQDPSLVEVIDRLVKQQGGHASHSSRSETL